jgi:hypothetical protein
MNRRILIVSLFATLTLLVPINSVVGVSDVEDDCGCQVVNRYDLFRVKLLMIRLKVITNTILLRFRHIPEIAEKCEEILDVINSNRQLDYPIICGILEPIFLSLISVLEIIFELMLGFENYPKILEILNAIFTPIQIVGRFVYEMGVEYGCEWALP